MPSHACCCLQAPSAQAVAVPEASIESRHQDRYKLLQHSEAMRQCLTSRASAHTACCPQAPPAQAAAVPEPSSPARPSTAAELVQPSPEASCELPPEASDSGSDSDESCTQVLLALSLQLAADVPAIMAVASSKVLKRCLSTPC